jgi:hypothetical protein
MTRQSQIQTDKLSEMLEDAWMGLKDVTADELFNPLENIPDEMMSQPHLYILWLFQNPDFFSLFVWQIFGIKLFPFQCLILKEFWNRRFPILIGSRGLGKSSIIAIYALLRMLFLPGRKIVITGAGFRQSKIIFEYCEKIWYNSPLLRDLVGNDGRNGPAHGTDMWRFVIGESSTIAIPIGNGERIRGQRAHDIVVDEFAVGNSEIFEHVISGFAAVSSDPHGNAQRFAKDSLARDLGIKLDSDYTELYQANQILLAGTAYYEFNHFFKYWKRNQQIIYSRGDKKKLADAGINDDGLDWRDYSVIRLPHTLLPCGFMEDAIVSRAKSSMNSSLFFMEYESCFSSDSNGFFKRALLEKCVDEHSISLVGSPNKKYVIGIDPASENDNFCITIVEVEKNIRRIVYCWTATKKTYKEELKAGTAKENDFYDYACRKILNLVNSFNVIGIAIDSEGGGRAVADRLHNPSIINADKGEVPLWPFVDPEKPEEYDIEPGLHIIELVKFANADWVSSANHDMRLEFETRQLLFPKFDGLTFAEIDLSTETGIGQCDITEEAVMEIEEMKNELSSIVMTQTPSGRDRWDTPDIKLPGAKKGRMRKDRYSSILLSSYMGRKLAQEKAKIDYSTGYGGAVKEIKQENIEKVQFIGADAEGMALAQKLNDLYS